MSQSTITTRVVKQLEDSDLVNTKNNSWSAQLCDPTYTYETQQAKKYLSTLITTQEFHFVVDIYTVLLVYEPLWGLNTIHEDLVLPFYHTIPLL